MTPPARSYREISLTKGQVTLVDEEDYPELAQFRWRVMWIPKMACFYAVRTMYLANGKQTTYLMRRQLLGLKHGYRRLVDHERRDKTLDNRRSNIRIATRKQNAANSRKLTTNTSGYRGVSFKSDGRPKPWYAQIENDDKNACIGHYVTAEEAARAYDLKNLELRGKFAVLNFPNEHVSR